MSSAGPTRTSTAVRALALAGALAAAAVAGEPTARAQGPKAQVTSAADASEVAGRAALIAERTQVRAQLDRVNAEIDALKRAAGQARLGLRDDYRLRARLADAEALARRLTDIDARLGGPARSPASKPGAGLTTAPTVSASDGPAEMEAKADILADQARRVAGQADLLSRRAGRIKARQALRRRAGELEHDPFSPLEGSRRRSLPVAAGVPATPSPNTRGSEGTAPDSTAISPGIPTSVGAGSQSQGASAVSADPPAAGTSSTPHPLVAPGAPPSPTADGTAGESASLAAQLRDLLDSTTLAEIRRLEASRAPGAGAEALERAAAALRARAEQLNSQSHALRARARGR